MLVNVGCGDYKPPGWVHVDSWVGANPDVVASAGRLPFADDCVERLYCGHMLEHVDREMVPTVLAEFRRVLVPRGRLCVVGPDYVRAKANPEWHPLLSAIRDGGRRWPGDEHRWLSTGSEALRLIVGVFPDAVEVPVADTVRWPVWDRVGWQFAVVASK